MRDDWRVHVHTDDEAAAARLAEGLERYDLAHDLGGGFHDRVAVSRDHGDLFLYTSTREQAQAAERAVGALAEREGWALSHELRRWHPVAERWEDPDLPLPADDAALLAEHAEAAGADEHALGTPEFEVRVTCASESRARRLAAHLRVEGIPCVQRWRFVVVGAPDGDAAEALAARLREEVPSGSEVVAEGSVAWAVHAAPLATPFNPFSIFGGLGG